MIIVKIVSKTFSGAVADCVGSVHFQIFPWPACTPQGL